MTERYGMVIGLRPERVADDKRLHASVWPGVLDAMRRNGWCDFDSFLNEPENLLIGTFTFDGPDFAAPAHAIGIDPETKAWLRETDPCQAPVETRKPGERWAHMENIFHMD